MSEVKAKVGASKKKRRGEVENKGTLRPSLRSSGGTGPRPPLGPRGPAPRPQGSRPPPRARPTDRPAPRPAPPPDRPSPSAEKPPSPATPRADRPVSPPPSPSKVSATKLRRPQTHAPPKFPCNRRVDEDARQGRAEPTRIASKVTSRIAENTKTTV